MEGSHFPSCPLHEQSPQTPSCGAAHLPPSPVTQTHISNIMNANINVIFIHATAIVLCKKRKTQDCQLYVTAEILTPILKRELTGLWSLVFIFMWLRYSICLTLLPLHRILSHQAGTLHFPLQETGTVSEAKSGISRLTNTVMLTLYFSVAKGPEKKHCVIRIQNVWILNEVICLN